MFGRRGFLASLVACLFAPLARVWGEGRPSSGFEAAGQIDWDELRAATISVSGEQCQGSTTLKVLLHHRMLVTAKLNRPIIIQEMCSFGKHPGAVWDVIRAEKRFTLAFDTTGPSGIQAGARYLTLTVKDGVRGVSSC